jgi:hypothetical protein
MTQSDFSFFVRVYGRASSVTNDQRVSSQPSALNSLGSHFEGSLAPLPVDFDSLGRELERWPNLYFEWDGSFVWVSQDRLADGSPAWQVDGMLYDHAGVLQYVELKGYCPLDAWCELTKAMGITATAQQAMIHDVANDRWLDQTTFELLISKSSSSSSS